MDASPQSQELTESGWPPWVETWVLPYMQDSALWGVFIALLGHAVIIIAPLFSMLARGELIALLPMFGVVMLSGNIAWMDIRRTKGPGVVLGVIVATWVVAIAVGYIGFITDIF